MTTHLLLSTSNKKKNKGQSGGTPISRRINRPLSYWYTLCETFEDGLKARRWKTQTEFLRSSSALDASDANKMSFSRNLRRFRAGDLPNSKQTRTRVKKFQDVADHIVEYVSAQNATYEQDKCGISWITLHQKALAFAKRQGHSTDKDDPNSFRASSGWISRVLDQHDLLSINLHGEASDITDEAATALINPFRAELLELMDENDIDLSPVYNADIKMAILADELNAAVEAEEKWLLISSEDFSRPSFFRSYKEIAQWNHEGGRDWSLKKMVEFREREDAKRIRKYREAKAKRQREAEKEGEDGEGKFEDHQHDTKRPRFPKNLFAFTASNKVPWIPTYRYS